MTRDSSSPTPDAGRPAELPLGHPVDQRVTEPLTPDQLAAERMLAVDARPVLLTGIALFTLAFLVLLPFWSWLGQHGHRVWLQTALVGAVLGVLALPLVRKHTGEGRLG